MVVTWNYLPRIHLICIFHPVSAPPTGFFYTASINIIGGVSLAKVEQKQVVVNEIKEKLEKATSAVLVDARGLSVAEDTELRKQLREAGVDYKVTRTQ